ncbi:MAG: PA14 domain-containing protein [Deinococcales bacterium]
MLNNSNYPYYPSGTELISTINTPTNAQDNYGSRIRGYIYPPISGDYHFWIASDDEGQLWLSTDENPANIQRIAYVVGWTNFQEWTKYSSQASNSIYLEAGKRYYFDIIHKDGTGADNLSVAWQIPGKSAS